MSRAQAREKSTPAAVGKAAAGITRSQSDLPAVVSPAARAHDPARAQIMLRLQGILEVTRRFFRIEPVARKPQPDKKRACPVPAPAAWHWCRRDAGQSANWYHKEYPYGAAGRHRGRV